MSTPPALPSYSSQASHTSEASASSQTSASSINHAIVNNSDAEKSVGAREDPKPDPNEVVWDGINDRENVRNMSNAKKWTISLILTSGAMCLTALSSAWGEANEDIVAHFDSKREIGELGLSMFVLGLAVGPLISAPLSEFYGRKPVYLGGLVVYLAFQFLVAFPTNIAGMIVGRLLCSMGGSVFMSNVPGSFADMFDKSQLGLPMAVFTVGPFMGPGLGPVISGFIVQQSNYRWVFYVFIIWSAVLLAAVAAVPETYGPILLKHKARRLRKETGNNDLYAPMERNSRTLLQSVAENSQRPIVLLATEPVLIVLCVYTGFLLSVVYMFFVAFPLVFTNVYGFKVQYVGLSFLGFTVAMAIGAASYPIWKRLHARETANNDGVPEPEFRLPQMCAGAVLSPIGLFMFAWTIYPSVHWMVPIIASGIFGMGCYLAFNGILTYTVEAYRQYAASATAANVFVRCLIACSSPLFGVQLMNNLGYHWALSLLGFISILLCPSAFIFRKYGRTLRLKSTHAYS